VSTVFDSATITIPAGSYYASTGVTFTLAGIYLITGTAQGYTPGMAQSIATGALVQMQPPNNTFVPTAVTIKAGETVTWQNVSTVTHTTTSDQPGWNATVNPGQTYTQTFPTSSGSPFTYHCNIHPGMTGTVIVNP